MKSLYQHSILLLSTLLSLVSADACGIAADALFKDAGRRGIKAEIAYDCLKSLPFHQEESKQLAVSVRHYLSYYSAGTYFQHKPCPELDLPDIDINGTLSKIEDRIKKNQYKSDYDVGKDFVELFGSVKDGHVMFQPVCTSGAFVYQHDYPLISVAASPDSIPEIYIAQFKASVPRPGEKVLKINGEDAVRYLEHMAKNGILGTYIDPDARFNQLLVQISGGKWVVGGFARRLVYEETPMKLTLASGTEVKIEWRATFQNPGSDSETEPVPFQDTNTFYRNICLRSKKEVEEILRGDIFQTDGVSSSSSQSRQLSHRPPTKQKLSVQDTKNKRLNGVFPQQHEPTSSYWPVDISWGTDGEEMGWYMLDFKTAVLIVNMFESKKENPQFGYNFSQNITKFLKAVKSTGAERLLIDVTGNGGGNVAIGQNLARQLFPTSDKVFFGSNMRWNPTLDVMMKKGDQQMIAASYFALHGLRKPSGENWTSFDEMLGPVHRDGDYFTKISITNEDKDNADTGIYPDYPMEQPFKLENVILVSSGLCGSTCAVFAEALQTIGVKSVTFGGRPRRGPMQAVGGVKGNQVLVFDDITKWELSLIKNDPTFNKADLSVQGIKIARPLVIRVTNGRINFRNSWRRDDGQHLPIEFLYTPTDWKLFYTAEMTSSVPKMHEAASRMAWGSGLKDMSGGPYTPINGFDGRGFKWPKGSGVGGGFGDGTQGVYTSQWSSLGQLIWKVMRDGKHVKR